MDEREVIQLSGEKEQTTITEDQVYNKEGKVEEGTIILSLMKSGKSTWKRKTREGTGAIANTTNSTKRKIKATSIEDEEEETEKKNEKRKKTQTKENNYDETVRIELQTRQSP